MSVAGMMLTGEAEVGYSEEQPFSATLSATNPNKERISIYTIRNAEHLGKFCLTGCDAV